MAVVLAGMFRAEGHACQASKCQGVMTFGMVGNAGSPALDRGRASSCRPLGAAATPVGSTGQGMALAWRTQRDEAHGRKGYAAHTGRECGFDRGETLMAAAPRSYRCVGAMRASS